MFCLFFVRCLLKNFLRTNFSSPTLFSTGSNMLINTTMDFFNIYFLIFKISIVFFKYTKTLKYFFFIFSFFDSLSHFQCIYFITAIQEVNYIKHGRPVCCMLCLLPWCALVWCFVPCFITSYCEMIFGGTLSMLSCWRPLPAHRFAHVWICSESFTL